MNVRKVNTGCEARRYLTELVTSLVLLGFLVSACNVNAPRVVKIGLVAPFEGRYREVGYDVIPAVRLAIREWAASTPGSRVVVELVAYDDGGIPEQALEQAHKLVDDQDVVVVIGHWRDDTTREAAPIYKAGGLTLLTFATEAVGRSPSVYSLSPSAGELRLAVERYLSSESVMADLHLNGDGDVIAESMRLHHIEESSLYLGGPTWGLSQFYLLAGSRAEGAQYVTGAIRPEDLSTEAARADEFTQKYREANLNIPPGPLAPIAYDAARLSLLALDSCLDKTLSRGSVGIALGQASLEDGLTGPVAFTETGRRLDAPILLYEWRAGERILVKRLQ